MADWTDAELRATVCAYLEMVSAQRSGTPYSKAAIRRSLIRGPLQRRSEGSIEFRMRNISAVLQAHGLPYVTGYLPAENVGDLVAGKIWQFLREESPGLTRNVSSSQQTIRGGSAAAAANGHPPIIFFNIGWMEEYAGPSAVDRTVGGHGYLASHEHGAEAFNFLPNASGKLEGYRPGHERGINLTKLGGLASDESVDGATVVWLAKEPVSKHTMIVGWYTNATVYRTSLDGGRRVNGEAVLYSVEAAASDAKLLPVLARNFEIRSARLVPGGFGQSPIWYGSEEINRRVWDYIKRSSRSAVPKASGGSGHPPKNLDPELRRKVEKAAVDHARAYYQSAEGGFGDVESVEPYGYGWDLEVNLSDQKLLVEVKGLSGPDLVCELTPNEYEKMHDAANQERYTVYVVCNALSETPIASIFNHVGDGQWSTADGRKLVITPRTGAVLRCN